MIDLNRHYAERLDRDDELAPLREQFVIADEELLYMDGNSLGRLPRKAASRALALIDHEWGEELIGGWNGGWYEAPLRVGDTIGSLIGAAAGQVAVTDSTSVNLYKLVIAALRLRPGRHRIVTDTLNFPSDYYIIQSAIDLLSAGHDLVRAASRDGGVTPDLDELVRSIDSDTALIVLS
ncbi:MAG TPA: kynureninase, partial [Spirochaetia bacterium]|nr:kynureninase [Spirochaetia bacterium]